MRRQQWILAAVLPASLVAHCAPSMAVTANSLGQLRSLGAGAVSNTTLSNTTISGDFFPSQRVIDRPEYQQYGHTWWGYPIQDNIMLSGAEGGVRTYGGTNFTVENVVVDGMRTGYATVVTEGVLLSEFLEQLLGDLDGNGAINGTDWTLFKAGSNTDLSGFTQEVAYQHGDLNGDFLQNLADFGIFKTAYDQANGAGAFAAMVAAVPEPSAIALAVMSPNYLWTIKSVV